MGVSEAMCAPQCVLKCLAIAHLQEQRRLQKEGRIQVSSERRTERRRRLWLFIKNYWHRLVGAAVGWFAWDFYYCEPCALSTL